MDDICPTCGRRTRQIGTRRKTGRAAGLVMQGGVPNMVIEWCRANPEEELTSYDISVKFTMGEMEPNNIRKALVHSVKFGYLASHVNDRGRRVYYSPLRHVKPQEDTNQ